MPAAALQCTIDPSRAQPSCFRRPRGPTVELTLGQVWAARGADRLRPWLDCFALALAIGQVHDTVTRPKKLRRGRASFAFPFDLTCSGGTYGAEWWLGRPQLPLYRTGGTLPFRQNDAARGDFGPHRGRHPPGQGY